MKREPSTFELLKKRFLSAEHEDVLDACDELIEINNDAVIDFFIDQLDSDRGYYRNLSANALKEMKVQKSVASLIKNILKPQNSKSCGSMVLALTELDCTHHFLSIFKIYIFGNYECKVHANSILNEQSFNFNRKDLSSVEEMWQECLSEPDKCPCFDSTKDYIEQHIESFRQQLTAKDN